MKWIKAARLRTLPLSLAGIIMGGALGSGFTFDLTIFLLCLATATSFQILSNFANDYGDFEKGTDNENRIGPKRTMQAGLISKKEMKSALIITGLISLFLGSYLSYLGTMLMGTKQLILFLTLGVLCIVAALKYTMGKRAYGYSGLGDIFVFIFFGIIGVLGSYYLINAVAIQPVDWLPAISIGLLSVGVLNLNNMRDEHNDKANNKNTLVVKLGLQNAKIYHYFLIGGGMLVLLVHAFIISESVCRFTFVLPYFILIKHLIFVSNTNENVKFDPELKKVALSTFLISILYFTATFFSC